MLNILGNRSILDYLDCMPTIRESNWDSIKDLRRKTGLGCYLCSALIKKTKDNQEAIILLKDIISGNKKIDTLQRNSRQW